MMLDENIKGLCSKYGLDHVAFLADFGIENVQELTLFDLQAIAEEYEVDLYALLFKPLFPNQHLKDKLKKIKLLVLDVDGVMTDGGMYFTESGDQFKKFNTKDGMAIIQLTKNNFQIAIISSGFVSQSVEARAKMLGIQHCVVSRDKKIDVLQQIIEKLNLSLAEVAIIGDDINDLDIMKSVSIAACPKDAVQEVKNNCHIVLNTNGGRGCVREFIDLHLIDKI
ncbi:MAG TPA: HAD hydrolase family protein [Taishania sp.]|nr:HAD hydrolase family protein [Taishania sp.]HNS41649.1 HAD hydrolase family protein [Taishania sp.]